MISRTPFKKVIPEGETEVELPRPKHLCLIEIYAPDTLTGTVTVETQVKDSGRYTVKEDDGTTDLTIAVDSYVVFNPPGERTFLVSSGAEAADRIFWGMLVEES